MSLTIKGGDVVRIKLTLVNGFDILYYVVRIEITNDKVLIYQEDWTENKYGELEYDEVCREFERRFIVHMETID